MTESETKFLLLFGTLLAVATVALVVLQGGAGSGDAPMMPATLAGMTAEDAQAFAPF